MKNLVFNRIFLISISILLVQFTYCQENFLPGFVIQNSGDTIHGFVDYRNWVTNPDKISFKENVNNEPAIFTPINIKEFGVLDEIYESAIVETEISPDNTSNLQFDNELIIKIDTTYLQAVVKGMKSLYFYVNKNGQEQFYIKQNSSFELLIHKKYLKLQEGQGIIAENKKFIGQLTLYLNDCLSISAELKKTEYRKKSLEHLLLYYYNCSNSEITFRKNTEKLSAQIGALAGLSLTSLKFSSSDFAYLVNAGYQQSANFSCGIFLDLVLPRNQKKLSIYNELIFSSYKVNGRYDEFENENKYKIYHTTIGYSYLKVNNLIRFQYPVGSLFLFANTGFSNGIAIGETNYCKKVAKFYDSETVEEFDAIADARKWEIGFLLGTGAKFKRYSAEIRYELGNGMSTFTNLKSSTNRFYVFFGYRF